ncbi:hypothetical protein D0Z07_5070 [Hyphodiscus hymeniophilus]|uniref:Carboxymuconolactone decarboxylase-like domain-containing protein n=1 Tax=Hyphodiscus hymeniophilus TaxID=353542 RepID=A0A9P7AWP6_9HELO|nr:hypothetical protein D0Z07_5070 [Hyphodiscus hymeniophilus]
MATTNTETKLSPEIPNTEKERAIKAVTEFLGKLKEDEPTSQQDLMNLFESLSALTGAVPAYAGDLYTFLINKPEYQASDSRRALVRRMREALVKNVSVQGVCRPLEAVFAIEALERPEDQDFSCSREHWKAGPDNRARGEKWLNTIYQGNLSTTTDRFLAHKDFDFISREITYGLYLSDHSILDPVATELVTLTGIMIQNLPLETAWHLRGTRRVGVSIEDVELVQQCVKMVADFGFVSQSKVPRVTDIEHEV